MKANTNATAIKPAASTGIHRFSTKKQLARIYQCSVRHIEKLVKARQIPVRRLGRLVRFDISAVERALARYDVKAIGD